MRRRRCAPCSRSAAPRRPPFLVYEDERLTFDEHYRRCAAFAHALAERYGVGKGDRVAIAMRNFPEWSVAFWAAAALGAIVVPLNAWWTGDGARLRPARLAARSVLVRRRRARSSGCAASAGAAGLDARHRRARAERRWRRRLERVRADATGRRSRRRGAARRRASTPRTTRPSSTRRAPPGGPRARSARTATSATTSCRSASRAARTLLRRGEALPAPATAAAARCTCCRCRSSTPPAATRCWCANARAPAASSCCMHKWDPERALELIERERVTDFGGVPAMVWQVLEHRRLRDATTSRASRRSATAARPPRPSWSAASSEHFPARMPGNGYGLTETSSVTTHERRRATTQRKPDSVGAAGRRSCDVQRRRRRRRTTLPAGEVGELWIKGPNVVKGYWNKPEATARDLRRRLAAHRRPRPPRRRGLRLHRRPRQGHGHPRRRERLLRRGRGRALRASRRSPTRR